MILRALVGGWSRGAGFTIYDHTHSLSTLLLGQLIQRGTCEEHTDARPEPRIDTRPCAHDRENNHPQLYRPIAAAMHAAKGHAVCLAACGNDLGRQYCVKMNACSVLPAAHRFPILSSAWVDEVHARRARNELTSALTTMTRSTERRGQKSTPRLWLGRGDSHM